MENLSRDIVWMHMRQNGPDGIKDLFENYPDSAEFILNETICWAGHNKKMDLIKQLLISQYRSLVTVTTLEIVIEKCYHDADYFINWIFDEYPKLIYPEILEEVVTRACVFQYPKILERIFEEYPDEITMEMFKNAVANLCLYYQFEKAMALYKKYSHLIDENISRMVMIYARNFLVDEGGTVSPEVHIWLTEMEDYCWIST